MLRGIGESDRGTRTAVVAGLAYAAAGVAAAAGRQLRQVEGWLADRRVGLSEAARVGPADLGRVAYLEIELLHVDLSGLIPPARHEHGP